MRSVKEFVLAYYLDEIQIVPIYQHARYASNYDMDAAELHELYKQRSTSSPCTECRK